MIFERDPTGFNRDQPVAARVHGEIVLAPQIDGTRRWRVDHELAGRRPDQSVNRAATQVHALAPGCGFDNTNFGAGTHIHTSEIFRLDGCV
jgi:hypothetical protein